MSVMQLQTAYTQNPANYLVGQVSRALPEGINTLKNAGASLASIPIGSPIVWKPSGRTSDKDVALPANSTDVFTGIVIHSDDYQRAWTDDSGTHGELDSTGIVANALMNVLREGEIAVTCITGCVPGDRLFISYAVGGPYTALGQLGNATQASTTIDCTTKGEWRTTAVAGAIAILKLTAQNK